LFSVGGSNRLLMSRPRPPVETIFVIIARPDGFEPPTTWFEAVRAFKFGFFDDCM
jgi:hypothetical protein